MGGEEQLHFWRRVPAAVEIPLAPGLHPAPGNVLDGQRIGLRRIVPGCDYPRKNCGGDFKESGVEGIWSKYSINPFDSELGEEMETILSALCRVGYPGELFTSAAPQDPLFWSLHGNSERFLMLARLLKTSGVLDFSERWG